MKLPLIPLAILIACTTGLSFGGIAAIVDELIGEIPSGKSIIVSHAVIVNGVITAATVTSQGTVSGVNFSNVLTDDPDVGGSVDPTATDILLNTAPVLASIAKAVTEDVPANFSAADFDAGFSDGDVGDILETLRIISLPGAGTLKLSGVAIVSIPVDILRANIPTLSYEPDLNENGPDSFSWNASDGALFAATNSLVLISVAAVNDLPILANIAKGVTEDTAASFAASEFDAGFSDDDTGEILQTLRITSAPSKGTLLISGVPIVGFPADILRANIGTLSYDPNLNEVGSDSFGWNGSDGTAFALTNGLVNISIAAVNDRPVADPETVERYPTSSLKIPIATLLAGDTDPEGDVPTFVGVNSPTANGATISSSSSLVFYLPNGHTGADTFEYIIQDSLGLMATGTVTVAIITDNDAGANVVSITAAPPNVEVIFAGIPGRTYSVESLDTFPTPPWDFRASVLADAQGRILLGPPTRLYRTTHP
jgi:hypothetical protein